MFIIPQKVENINDNRYIAAQEMVRRGFYLLPLKPKDKIPYTELLPGNSWKTFSKNKATSAIVKSWFNHDKNINFGIITGVEVEEGYKLIVVDFDHKPKIGLPVTPIVESSRGYHVYFKCRSDRLPKPNKTKQGEIKINGYVVAPPSIHPTGQAYQWAEFLSFMETPLADFDTRRTDIIKALNKNGKTRKEDKKKEYYPTRNISCRVPALNLSFQPTSDTEYNKQELCSLLKNEQAIFKIMTSVFNVTVDRLGKSFLCPLHKETKPSAALYRSDSGDIGIKDFHRGGLFYTLPEFYFEYLTGKEPSVGDNKLKGGTWLIWWIRLLVKAGLVDIPRIIPPKPMNDLTDNQRQLYKGFIELLEVQQAYDPEQKGAPFSHRFAVDWCNMKRITVRSAKDSLFKKRYIKKIKKAEGFKAGKWDLVRD